MDCPSPVDLALIVVPPKVVVPVAVECAEKGVRALVVITAGFAETGQEGAQLQQELVEGWIYMWIMTSTSGWSWRSEMGAEDIVFKAIGYVENDFQHPVSPDKMYEAESRIVMDPTLVEGLTGLVPGTRSWSSSTSIGQRAMIYSSIPGGIQPDQYGECSPSAVPTGPTPSASQRCISWR